MYMCPALRKCRAHSSQKTMSLTAKKAIPLLFVVVSILYIIFSFSLEQRRMIGDERGWDPGSRAMPLGIGFIMLGASIYLVLKEARTAGEGEEPLDSGSIKLISLTIMLSVFYILFFRYVGFILSTNTLLFTLIYFNYRRDITWNVVPNFLPGLVVSTGFILLLYSIGRFATRFLFLTGKRSNIEILTNRLSTTGITFIVLTGIFLITLFLFKKFLKTEQSKIFLNVVLIATGMTEFLYLIFKQIFWVSLAKGIIFW